MAKGEIFQIFRFRFYGSNSLALNYPQSYEFVRVKIFEASGREIPKLIENFPSGLAI